MKETRVVYINVIKQAFPNVYKAVHELSGREMTLAVRKATIRKYEIAYGQACLLPKD